MKTKPITAFCLWLPAMLWLPGACGGEEPDAGTGPLSGTTLTGDLSGSLRVVYRPDGIAVHPDDEAWDDVPTRLVQLTPQTITLPRGGGSTPVLAVQGMHDSQRMSIRLIWEDERPDRSVGVSTFRDSVAIGFPVAEGATLPSPFMGDVNKPVNIWQWTADFDANQRGLGSFAEAYPHTEGVWYFPQDDMVSQQVRAWRGFEPVIELEARGFGSLERKGTQNVSGTGIHDRGRWHVVFRRQLATGLPQDTLFRPGDSGHAIFAVWDGSAGEVNGIKSITTSWILVELEETRRVAGR